MLDFRTAAGAATICVAFGVGTVSADVTGQEVWDAWKTYMQSYGYSVTATETSDGGGLSLRDVTMRYSVPEEDGEFVVSIPTLTFRNRTDGTVTVDFPQKMPMSIAARNEKGEPVEIDMSYTQTGLSMTVSGDENRMSYAYSAVSLAMALDGISEAGKPLDDMAANLEFDGVLGSATLAQGDLRELDQTMQARSVSYLLDVREPGSDNSALFKGRLDGVDFSGASVLPSEMDPEDVAAMFAGGMSVTGAFSHSGAESEFVAQDKNQRVASQSRSAGGGMSVLMNGERMSFDAESRQAATAITSSDLPLPIELSMDRAEIAVSLPVAEAEEPQDFAFGVTLSDLAVSDMLWSLFDAGQVLPRDPATLVIDVTGTTTVEAGLTTPQKLERLGRMGKPPALLETLSLNRLVLSIAGAMVTGDGSFSFDNTDTATFDGMPRPEGSASVEVKGANGLMEKLVQMGLLPEQQAMGARMMLGLFAVPVGDDHLRSTIEVNDKGHVLANGQRIQ